MLISGTSKPRNLSSSITSRRTAIAAVLPMLAVLAGCVDQVQPARNEFCTEPSTTTVESKTRPVSLTARGICIKLGGEFSLTGVETTNRLPIIVGCNDEFATTIRPADELSVNIGGEIPLRLKFVFDISADGKIGITQTECALEVDSVPELADPNAFFYSVKTR